MSEPSTATSTRQRIGAGVRLRRVGSRHQGRGNAALLVAQVAVVGLALVALLGSGFAQDTWLALAAGREIWHGGVPHHETLTLIAHGKQWVDQQWLAHLTMYALYRVGGFGLLAVLVAGLTIGGLALAVSGGLRLGVSAPTLTALLPVCALLTLFASVEVRTQAFAYPLFVALVLLLAADARAPSRRVYLCFPLLVVWANLHGSASLGAGLVVLRGLTVAWERRGALAADRAWPRAVLLTLGAPLCLLATPYGTGMVDYYGSTLLNRSFGLFVTEWRPVTSSALVAVPFFALAGVALWSFGRHTGRTTLWERGALLLLGVAAIDAVRNVVWFALAGLIVIGLSLDHAARARRTRPRPRQPRLNAVIVLLAVGSLLVVAGTTVTRHDRSFERSYPRGALAAVRLATTRDVAVRVLADDRYADWLLWHDPALRGRMALDVRFELLSETQLRDFAKLTSVVGTDWKKAARGYRLLVLDRKGARNEARAFLREPGRRVLFEDSKTVVLLRSPVAAAA